MRRQPHEPRPPEWVIHSTFVPRRDGPRRLGQAFQILLGSPPVCQDKLTHLNRSTDHASRDLRPGLDREAGPGPDD
jgi:hypothetical protein